MSSRFIGIVSLVALLAASSAHAQSRKRGRGRGRSPATESSSGSRSSSQPPSSLVAPSPPVETTPPPPPPDLQPKPAEPATPPDADSSPENDADRPRISLMPLVLVGVEPLWEGRVFRHTEFTNPNVRRYDARGYPAIALNAEVFPLVKVGAKFLRGFGVTLHYARAFGFQSSSARLGADVDARSMPVDTSFTRYAAGLRYRIHTNAESQTPFVFGVSASLAGWRFDFGPELPRDVDLELPTAIYRAVRIGFDAGLEVRPVTFYAAASYLHAFSVVPPNTRELDVRTYPYLPGAVGMGGEFRGAVGVRVVRWLEVRLSVEYAILGFHLKPLEGRPDSPARVLDSYLSAGLGPYVSF
jgi:hypothetical protein